MRGIWRFGIGLGMRKRKRRVRNEIEKVRVAKVIKKDIKEKEEVKKEEFKNKEAKDIESVKALESIKNLKGVRDIKDIHVAANNPGIGESGANPSMDIEIRRYDFAKHMINHIGETVTVFVKSGGSSGKSFTGMLYNASPYYIQLLSQTGPTPCCIFPNACNNEKKAPCCNNLRTGAQLPFTGCNHAWTYNANGAVIYIPTEKIVSFIHNSL